MYCVGAFVYNDRRTLCCCSYTEHWQTLENDMKQVVFSLYLYGFKSF